MSYSQTITPTQWLQAASNNNVSVVQRNLKLMAGKVYNNTTALIQAAAKDCVEIVQLLAMQEKGLKPGGKSALDFALDNKATESAEILMKLEAPSQEQLSRYERQQRPLSQEQKQPSIQFILEDSSFNLNQVLQTVLEKGEKQKLQQYKQRTFVLEQVVGQLSKQLRDAGQKAEVDGEPLLLFRQMEQQIASNQSKPAAVVVQPAQIADRPKSDDELKKTTAELEELRWLNKSLREEAAAVQGQLSDLQEREREKEAHASEIERKLREKIRLVESQSLILQQKVDEFESAPVAPAQHSDQMLRQQRKQTNELGQRLLQAQQEQEELRKQVEELNRLNQGLTLQLQSFTQAKKFSFAMFLGKQVPESAPTPAHYRNPAAAIKSAPTPTIPAKSALKIGGPATQPMSQKNAKIQDQQVVEQSAGQLQQDQVSGGKSLRVNLEEDLHLGADNNNRLYIIVGITMTIIIVLIFARICYH